MSPRPNTNEAAVDIRERADYRGMTRWKATRLLTDCDHDGMFPDQLPMHFDPEDPEVVV